MAKLPSSKVNKKELNEMNNLILRQKVRETIKKSKVIIDDLS